MCTRPWATRLAAAGHGYRRRQAAEAVAAITLELGEAPWAGVPCWTGRLQRWVTWTVPVAFDCRYDTQVRPVMPGNPISRRALLAVAGARARYADYATGRNCRPSNERLAADTGYSVRTVQRADTVLRLLGVATEVLRGRQRTRAERMASWRVGDRRRGWASVWALHDHPQLTGRVYRLSPHLRSGPVRDKNSPMQVVTTDPGGPTDPRPDSAPHRRAPDARGGGLARAWRADRHSPPWARRHSANAWAALLAAPAAHGWSARDLNALIADWAGVTGNRIPDNPHKPIGLLGAMLAWHGRDNLDARPAALDEAREAAAAAAHRAHLAAQHDAHTDHLRARAAGRRALGGAGHTAARAAAAVAARRGAHNRTTAAAQEAAAREAAAGAARAARPVQR
ncbi:helix-turn-helix domain-containing protein [Mycobacterium intracellulare]|uniref:helix-turn-helix domain-containing protein n=1 Tax=Mycobacterium intracellulare TaxID=1767 RepID=UPI000A6D2D9A|nr:helix-turn-helix domain-containing protein [Mycobacterium intracellulare]MEE3755385.1 helix-turn-helix domain-containing protein [Mycobacterium intracellulare]